MTSSRQGGIRVREMSRLEALSDAIFGFSATLAGA
jgi:hypothetical protein